MLRDLFRKTEVPGGRSGSAVKKNAPAIPDGIWRKCRKCGAAVYAGDVKRNYYACPKCGGYFRVHAYRRIEMLADAGSFEEWDRETEFVNPLHFPGYEDKIREAAEKSKLNEAVVTGKLRLDGIPCAFGVCDARFMMSSMGHCMGEKITRATERAAAEGLPFILYACSGGARMQEGTVSLMQMAKTAGALRKLHEAGQVFVSVLTDPTMGGVTASFAMLGDIILAEPKALIGFAGPRVIAQTIGEKLPEGFQRAEFLLQHGFLDAVVRREEQKAVLAEILRLHCSGKGQRIAAEKTADGPANAETAFVGAAETETAAAGSPGAAEKNAGAFSDAVQTAVAGSPGAAETQSAWDTVLLARSRKRLTADDCIAALFPDFLELHGDRRYGDDAAVLGGIASFHGIPVTVVGQRKGRTAEESRAVNFGMACPEGYRKAQRLFRQADDFGRPVICFVDTPGAFCGIGAEERGQGQAIAENLSVLSGLRVPVLSVVIGEGGSGGALGLAVANEVWMLENAVYSILSPEGFAAILYRDAKKCREAAEEMKITSRELKALGVIERIIPERNADTPSGQREILRCLDREITGFLGRFLPLTGEELVRHRYERFRKF